VSQHSHRLIEGAYIALDLADIVEKRAAHKQLPVDVRPAGG
jgi:hypothetical protein